MISTLFAVVVVLQSLPEPVGFGARNCILRWIKAVFRAPKDLGCNTELAEFSQLSGKIVFPDILKEAK